MPRPRFEKLPPEKKRRILDAAIDEFAEHGFEQASYNQIIERAGVSKGAMYYYFDGKADLYVTILEEISQEKLNFLGTWEFDSGLDDPFWDGLAQMSRMAMDFATERPELGRLARSFIDVKPGALGEAGDRLMAMGHEKALGLLEMGQQMGAVRTDLDVDLLTRLMMGLGEVFDRWWLAIYDLNALTPEDKDELIAIFIDLARRLLHPTAGGSLPPTT